MSLSNRHADKKPDLFINEVGYTYEGDLENRGQAALAGFYLDPEDRSFLIKEDPLAVALLESSAGFIKEYLPEAHKNVVNFAEFAWVTKSDTTEVAASKQPKLSNVKQWDVLVIGKKRWAQSPISAELFYNRYLQSHLNQLSHHVKSDLAVGLFASSLAGDESAHMAQFMAILDENKEKIIGLIRIDIGARERFALKRALNNDVKAKTSDAYAKSSLQIGKNYLDFLLKNPDLNAKYLRLCMLSVKDPDKLGREGAQCFFDELAKLPEEHRRKALSDVYQIYAKNDATLLTEVPPDEKTMRQCITMCIAHRARSLQEDAKTKINTALNRFKKAFPVPTPDLTAVMATENKKMNGFTIGNISCAVTEMLQIYHNSIKNGASEKEIKLYIEQLSHLYAAVEFSRFPLNTTVLQREGIKKLQEQARAQQKGYGNWVKNHKKEIAMGVLIGGLAIGTVLTLGATGIIAGGMLGGFVWLGSQLTFGAAISAPVAVFTGIAATGIATPLICIPTYKGITALGRRGIKCVLNCLKSSKGDNGSENNKQIQAGAIGRRLSSTATINIFPEPPDNNAARPPNNSEKWRQSSRERLLSINNTEKTAPDEPRRSISR